MNPTVASRWSFDAAAWAEAAPWVLGPGLVYSLHMAVCVGFGGLLLGALLAALRALAPAPLCWLARAWIDGLRALPLVLVLFAGYLALPQLGLMLGWGRPWRLDPWWTGWLAMSVFHAAYFAEILRSGLNAVPKGQLQAALALGLRPASVYGRVLLPQALRFAAPMIVTQGVVIFKDTALLYLLGLADMFAVASSIGQRDNRLPEMYALLALAYVVLCSLGAALAERLTQRHRPGGVGAGAQRFALRFGTASKPDYPPRSTWSA